MEPDKKRPAAFEPASRVSPRHPTPRGAPVANSSSDVVEARLAGLRVNHRLSVPEDRPPSRHFTHPGLPSRPRRRPAPLLRDRHAAAEAGAEARHQGCPPRHPLILRTRCDLRGGFVGRRYQQRSEGFEQMRARLLQAVALLKARGVLFPPFEPGKECLVGIGVRVEPDDRQPEPGADHGERDDSRNAEEPRNSRRGLSCDWRFPPSTFSPMSNAFQDVIGTPS